MRQIHANLSSTAKGAIDRWADDEGSNASALIEALGLELEGGPEVIDLKILASSARKIAAKRRRRPR